MVLVLKSTTLNLKSYSDWVLNLANGMLIMNNMNTLTVSKEAFVEMLSGLIMSGVTFTAQEKNGRIEITFTGGY